MGAAGGSGRKPYNPILAEQFHPFWTGDFGTLTLTSEQGAVAQHIHTHTHTHPSRRKALSLMRF